MKEKNKNKADKKEDHACTNVIGASPWIGRVLHALAKWIEVIPRRWPFKFAVFFHQTSVAYFCHQVTPINQETIFINCL